jgi:hypothetical protein
VVIFKASSSSSKNGFPLKHYFVYFITFEVLSIDFFLRGQTFHLVLLSSHGVFVVFVYGVLEVVVSFQKNPKLIEVKIKMQNFGCIPISCLVVLGLTSVVPEVTTGCSIGCLGTCAFGLPGMPKTTYTTR